MIFKMLLRRQYKSMLMWSLSIGLMMYLIIILYPFVKDVYQAMPAEVLVILDQFGGLPENVLEYYATEGAMMLQLFGSIYACLLGFGLISTFEKEKTAEVLFAQGISKTRFHISQIIILALMIGLFSLIQGFLGYVGFISINETKSLSNYLYFQAMNTIALFAIGLLGYLLALLLKPTVKQMVALIIPLPLYIITVISTLTNETWIKNLKYGSPFTFSDPVVILKEQQAIDLISLYIYIGLSILVIIGGTFLFKKRIHVY